MSQGTPTTGDERILVTGGAGFIGANLARALLDLGFRVTVLDNLSAGTQEHLNGLQVEFVSGDILDVDLVNKVVPGHYGVVHLAAQAGVPSSLADPRRDCETNVTGTLNLLEASRAARVRRFVFASSNAVLGRQAPPASEDKVPLPISPYGASKLAGEAYCLAYHASWNLDTTVLRFGNVYGPFSAHKQSAIAKMFKDILTKKQLTIEGDGEQTRDFIHVRDLCRAVVLALRSDVSGEIFQIAAGVETSILGLTRLLGAVVGGDVELKYDSARRGDPRRSLSAITKAYDTLGWRPEVQLPEGLENTWQWFRERKHRRATTSSYAHSETE